MALYLQCVCAVGIVDWGEVARHYGTVFSQRGGRIHLGFQEEKEFASNN